LCAGPIDQEILIRPILPIAKGIRMASGRHAHFVRILFKFSKY